MQTAFFQELATIVPELPNDAKIRIYNYPKEAQMDNIRYPVPRELGYASSQTFKTWLNIYYPENKIRIIDLSEYHKDLLYLYEVPPQLKLEKVDEGAGVYKIVAVFPEEYIYWPDKLEEKT